MLKSRRRWLRPLLILLILIPLAAVIGSGAYLVYTYRSIDLNRQLEQPSRLLDRDGNQFSRFAAEIRQVVSLEQMSGHLIDAVIAVEDARFYSHPGIDLRGITRALWRNLLEGRVLEGGSTITQQLAKNEYFIGRQGAARTLDRKLREAVYAIKLERTYTKDEILERYLNRIYFGHGRFGVETAAQFYFGKSAAELDLAEAALLAGIPRGPALYNPRDNPQRANERKDVVLARMEELGLIDSGQREEAAAQFVTAVELGERAVQANHFRQRVEKEAREILAEIYPNIDQEELTNLLYNHGLEIHTTLSLPLQIAAEQTILEHGASLLEKNENVQAALVAIDPATGGIMALVESIDLRPGLPRSQSRYDLGSTFKGILYAAALQHGYTASTPVLCEPSDFPDANPGWPTDFDGSYHYRELRVREALEVSCNVAAVRVGLDIGNDNFLALIARLNPRLAEKNIGAAVTAIPLSPAASILDLTLTYVPLANGGYSVKPYAISEIKDRNGTTIYQAWPRRQWVLDEKVAYIVTDMLTGVQGIAGRLPFAAAGKTGTTYDPERGIPNNTIFVGYTTDFVATVFFGFDKFAGSSELGNAVQIAAPAWRQFASRFYGENRPKPFHRPAGIEEAVVCTVSGKLAVPDCPSTYREFYLPGTVPTETCPVHSGDTVEICTVTWFPANRFCPQEVRIRVTREPWMVPGLQCWFHGPSLDQQEDENGEGETGEDDDEQNQGED